MGGERKKERGRERNGRDEEGGRERIGRDEEVRERGREGEKWGGEYNYIITNIFDQSQRDHEVEHLYCHYYYMCTAYQQTDYENSNKSEWRQRIKTQRQIVWERERGWKRDGE